MITLTKLNGTAFVLNCNLIETIYENPDTTIHLTNGPLYIVRESMSEVVRKTVQYHKDTLSNLVYKGCSGEPERQGNEGEGN